MEYIESDRTYSPVPILKTVYALIQVSIFSIAFCAIKGLLVVVFRFFLYYIKRYNFIFSNKNIGPWTNIILKNWYRNGTGFYSENAFFSYIHYLENTYAVSKDSKGHSIHNQYTLHQKISTR